MNGILYKRTPLRRIAETLHGALAQLGERMTGSHEVTGSIPISSMSGALAQLGERMTGSHEVTGSIPISSIKKASMKWMLFFCLCLTIAAMQCSKESLL